MNSKTLILAAVLLILGTIAVPVHASVMPSSQPAASRTFPVSGEEMISAFGVQVNIPNNLYLYIPSNGTHVKVNSFSILLWATGQTGPGPKNFPTGTIGVKAFGFMINNEYTFNLGSTPLEVFVIGGTSTTPTALQISIRTDGNTFWIWNPVTGVFTNVTAKTGYTVQDGLAEAHVVSPVFSWVITTPLS